MTPTTKYSCTNYFERKTLPHKTIDYIILVREVHKFHVTVKFPRKHHHSEVASYWPVEIKRKQTWPSASQ